MSSAQPFPNADLPGAGAASSFITKIFSAEQIVPTHSTGAGAGSDTPSPLVLPIPTTSHISASTTSAAPSPDGIASPAITSSGGIALPTHAISVAPPHLLAPSDQAQGPSSGNRVLTVDAITQNGQAETGSLVWAGGVSATLSVQPGISAARVLTVEVQPSSVSSFSTLVTAIPSPLSTSQPPFFSSPSISTPSARTSSASAVPLERLEMDQVSAQSSNIFNPDNRLFPLGVTAVSVAGIFIAIFATVLLVRWTGCCNRRRTRYDKRLALPSSVDVRDDSSSFHDRDAYRDGAPSYALPNHRPDVEKDAMAFDMLGMEETGGRDRDERYPDFSQAEKGSRGWDTSHGPPPHSGAGIASTTTTRQVDLSSSRFPRQSDSGYTAYEQIFFPSPFNDQHNQPTLNRPGRGLPTSIPSTPYNDPRGAANRIPRDSALVRLGNRSAPDNGSATSPFFPAGRPALILTNPDPSRQATPVPPLPATLPSTHVQYQGFQPRTLRNSTSTISSFDSSHSSLSAYSDMTRAQMPTFKFAPPTPAFMGGGAVTRGDGGRGAWIGAGRDRGSGTESLDVPKDAVSRPGSGNVVFSGEKSGRRG